MALATTLLIKVAKDVRGGGDTGLEIRVSPKKVRAAKPSRTSETHSIPRAKLWPKLCEEWAVPGQLARLGLRTLTGICSWVAVWLLYMLALTSFLPHTPVFAMPPARPLLQAARVRSLSLYTACILRSVVLVRASWFYPSPPPPHPLARMAIKCTPDVKTWPPPSFCKASL